MDFESVLGKYKNKKIGFVGVGISNTPIIELFLLNKIDVTIRDFKSIEPALKDSLSAAGARVVEGAAYLDDITEDLLFLAPAVKLFPELLEAKRKGTVLTGELAEFFSFCPCKSICITGSDGKTTTTTLIAKILEADGKTVHLGGNIGKNLFIELPNINPDDFVVAELSSFQLMQLNISPDVAVITNISPNHLDWHSDMDEYINAKKNIFLFQNNHSRLVLNYDNTICRPFADESKAKTVFFSKEKPQAEFYFDGRYIFQNGKQQIDCADMPLPGVHNRENLMAAAAATALYVDINSVDNVAKSFGGVEHRLEFVKEIGGVKFYNSSMDSSPTRTKAALESFDTPIVAIVGGYDKNLPTEPLADVFKAKVRAAVLIGATAEKVETMLINNGYSGIIIKSGNMGEAVRRAFSAALTGDNVVLSPAAASFDMFKNFAERGKAFKDAVNLL